MGQNDDEGIWQQRTEDLTWREIDDEVILLDLRTARYLRLNPTGAVLWGRLANGAALGDLVSCLQDHYSLDAAQAQADAAAFLRSCEENQLVRHEST